jgi:hypothetical protein
MNAFRIKQQAVVIFNFEIPACTTVSGMTMSFASQRNQLACHTSAGLYSLEDDDDEGCGKCMHHEGWIKQCYLHHSKVNVLLSSAASHCWLLQAEPLLLWLNQHMRHNSY